MAAVFSYAEAAKGLTPPAPAAQPEKTTETSTIEDVSDKVHQVDKDASETAVQPKDESQSPASGALAENIRIDTAVHTDAKEASNDLSSDHASPSLGADSTATLLKDDDPNGVVHDGSDSTTWEKVSQDSQTADKVSKADGESDDSKSTNWEHVSMPSLKDAPIPAVNPWLKRAQDMKTRAVASVITVGSTSLKSANDVAANDGKKKAHIATVEAGEMKNERRADGKTPTGEAPQRRYRPQSETKALARMPPPTSDAVSWPTPDLAAKPEDKKRSTSDKAEVVDDKNTMLKHGKKEWVSMPFVPTPVFNTPLPTGRRGGRPGGRGGRDGVSGRGPSGDSATDSTDRSPSTQRGEASVDGSKTDTANPRQGAANRQKRMSNASQSRPHALRREDGREDKNARTYDPDFVVSQEAAGEGRRHFQNPEPGDFKKRNHTSPGSLKMPTSNGVVSENTAASADSASRHSERRSDLGAHGMRENGVSREGRAERGGRGYRGRGGHGPATSHAGSYANGMNYQFVPGFNSAKGGPEQRSVSSPNFGGVGRDSRHVRAGSRSQPGQPPFHSRYHPNPGMGMGYPPMGPDMAAGYGFVPTMPLGFYHPYQDQQGLVGMIMEQMRYWFSFENLIRDLYLRKRMDDNGFVPLSFLMPWKRMQVLTSDVKMVRFACQNVPQVELCVDGEGNEHVRKAQDWEKWVMPIEDRHEEAQKDGTPQLFPVFPQGDPVHAQAQQSFPAQQRYQSKPPPVRVANGSSPHQSNAGNEEVLDGSGSGHQTPLSATVPEFKPEGRLAAKVNETSISEDRVIGTQVDDLSIISQTIPTE